MGVTCEYFILLYTLCLSTSYSNEAQVNYRAEDIYDVYLHRRADNGKIKNIMDNYTMKRRNTFTTTPKFEYDSRMWSQDMKIRAANKGTQQFANPFNARLDIFKSNRDKDLEKLFHRITNNHDIKRIRNRFKMRRDERVTTESNTEKNETNEGEEQIKHIPKGRINDPPMLSGTEEFQKEGNDKMLDQPVDPQITSKIYQSNNNAYDVENEKNSNIGDPIYNENIKDFKENIERKETNEGEEKIKVVRKEITDDPSMQSVKNEIHKHDNESGQQADYVNDEYIGVLADAMDKQQKLIVKLNDMLREKALTEPPDEFDKILASIEFKKTSISDPVTEGPIRITEDVVEETDIRAALVNNDLVKRILRIAKRINGNVLTGAPINPATTEKPTD